MAKRRVPDVVRQFLVEMERGGGHIGRKSRSKTKVAVAKRTIVAARPKRMRSLTGGPHAH